MAKFMFIERMLRNPDYSLEEKEDALALEELLRNVTFLALREIDEGFYSQIVAAESDYTFVENLLAGIVPNNILADLKHKVLGALSEIFKVDFLKTQDQSLLDPDFDLGNYLQGIKMKTVMVEKKDVVSDLNHLRAFLVGKTFEGGESLVFPAKVIDVFYIEETGTMFVNIESEEGKDILSLDQFQKIYKVPFTRELG